MADKNVEIKTKLTLDDAASKTLERLKGGFQSTAKEADAAKSKATSFATDFATTLLAVNFMPMLTGLKNIATELLGVVSGTYEFQQNVAGMIAGMQGIPWAEAREQAEGFESDLGEMAVNIGQSQDDINTGFMNMVNMMGGTSEAFTQAKGNIENMAVIASVTGMSVTDLGQSFGAMAEGMISKKSKITALLKPTGVFGTDLAKMTANWQQLTDEQRTDRLTTAFDQLAGNLKGAAPSMKTLTTSFVEMGNNVLDELGLPVIKTLIPILTNMKAELSKNRAEIEHYAHVMGEQIGDWTVKAFEKFREGAVYLETHSEEIKDAIIVSFEYAKSVVDFIIDHKEILAIAFGAKTVAPIVGGAVSGIGTAVSWASKLGGAGAMAAEGGAAVAGGGALAGAAVAAAPVVAFAAALAAAGFAAYEFSEYLDATNEDRQKFDAMAERMARFTEIRGTSALSPLEIKQVDEMRSEMNRLAESAGRSTGQVRELFDAFDATRAQARDIRQAVDPNFDEMQKANARMGEVGAAIAATSKGIATPEMQMAMMQAQQAMFGAQEGFTTAFQNAGTAHNLGAQQYMAMLLARSQGLQESFLLSSTLTADGFLTLAGLVGDQAQEFSDKLKQRGDDMKETEKKAVKPVSNIVMNGGQTFKITQDLRDQNPDRIAFVFRRDVAKAAENRTQSIFG